MSDYKAQLQRIERQVSIVFDDALNAFEILTSIMDEWAAGIRAGDPPDTVRMLGRMASVTERVLREISLASND